MTIISLIVTSHSETPLKLLLKSFIKLGISHLIFVFVGSDIPERSGPNMYPQDKVVPVGSNMTFCCIVKEKDYFKSIKYGDREMSATRLSRRTYAITVNNQPSSNTTGTNVFCIVQKLTAVDELITGAVVFVGCKYNIFIQIWSPFDYYTILLLLLIKILEVQYCRP